MLGIPGALNRDPGHGHRDIAEVVGRELDRNAANVLFQAVPLGGAGDGDNPGS
jgi:hypothetical protein